MDRRWSPCIDDGLHDLSRVAPTSTQLLDLEDPVAAVRDAGTLPRIGSVAEVLANSAYDRRDPQAPWLLAPCDLQAIKASGVTFVASLLERVIEEQARGDAAQGRGGAAVDRRRHRRQPARHPARLAAGARGSRTC